MPKQIKNNITIICFFIPMIIIAQIENNSQLANELLKTKNYLKASQLYNNLYNTHKSTNYYQILI